MDPGMIKNLALGSVPPALLALVFFALAWRRAPQGDQAGGWRVIVAPLVLALLTVGTYVLILGVPAFPPTSSVQWLPAVALAAGLAGVVANVTRFPVWVRYLPALLVLIGAWAVSARNLILNTWTAEQSAAELLEFLVAGVALTVSTAVLSRRHGPLGILALLVIAGAASQMLVLVYHNMKQAQIVGITAAALTPVAALAVLWRRQMWLGTGAAVFASGVMMASLFQGRIFGQESPEVGRGFLALLVLASMLGALVSLAVPDARPRLRAAAVLATLALPLGAGLGYAAKKYFKELEEAPDYGRAPTLPESPQPG